MPKSQLNPFTSQLSRFAGRTDVRTLRVIGRSAVGIAIGAVATAALVGEGFFDLTVEVKAAINATSFDDCGCK